MTDWQMNGQASCDRTDKLIAMNPKGNFFAEGFKETKTEEIEIQMYKNSPELQLYFSISFI